MAGVGFALLFAVILVADGAPQSAGQHNDQPRPKQVGPVVAGQPPAEGEIDTAIETEQDRSSIYCVIPGHYCRYDQPQPQGYACTCGTVWGKIR